MLNDALTRVSWRARPRSFVALMSLYESNYIRFGWLAGAVRSLTGRHCSVVAGDCDLLLAVTDHSPYTTTVNLTYRLPEQRGALRRASSLCCVNAKADACLILAHTSTAVMHVLALPRPPKHARRRRITDADAARSRYC